ncbi:MAG: hypothetical protein U0263_27070 [Polyangiaceae bacterium]
MSRFDFSRRGRFFGTGPLAFTAGLAFICVALIIGCSGGDEFKPNDSSNTGGAGNASSGGGSTSTGGAGGNTGDGGGAAGAPSGGGGGNPGGLPKGVACTLDSECETGFCADGVCCDSDCSGECRSCNQTAKVGSCLPHPVDTNPEDGCLAGAPSAGACTGTCDGQGECKFPGTEKSCGSSSCSAGSQTSKSCDGKGACTEEVVACGSYSCGPTECKVTCSTPADCVSEAFCSGGACHPKQELGGKCTAGTECKSGNCVDGSCCSTASCGPNFSCSTGTCQCNGQTCGAGAQCVTWYEDGDGDGFGDKSKSILGCSNAAPNVPGKKYVANDTDCMDTKSNVFPGQTAFFTVHRGDGSFDYDCSGQSDVQYPNVTGVACGDCGAKFLNSCYSCGPALGAPKAYAFGCPGLGGKCSGYMGVPQGFKANVPCGASAQLWECDGCSTATKATATVLQACH